MCGDFESLSPFPFGSISLVVASLCIIAITVVIKYTSITTYSYSIRAGRLYNDVIGHFHLLQLLIKLSFADGEVILQEMVKFLRQKTGPWKCILGGIHFIYVDKPEDLQIVLNNANALDKGKYYKFTKDVVGEGLFTAPVPKWKKHRRLFAPEFNGKMLENFLPVFNEKNKNLINKLKLVCNTKEMIDLWDYVAPLSLDIICETAMGLGPDNDTQANEKQEFQELVVKVSERVTNRIYKAWLHPDFIFKAYSKMKGHLNDNRQVQIFPKKVIKYKSALLKQTATIEKTSEEGTSKKFSTFLDMLLQLNEQGAELSDQDLYYEVITMMIGGTETTAITNCFTLLMLAMNSDIQEKVREEVVQVLGEADRCIQMNDVQRMPFLEQCIKETLRLFSTGPLLLRNASDEFKLSNDFVVQKGATIVYSPFMVHRNPEIYSNPLVWSPDNFSPEKVEKRHRYSFLGFSEGPRGCIGQKYALLSMKLTISLILKNFYLTTDVEIEDIRLKIDLLLRSVNGYKVKLHSRCQT